MHSQQTKKYKEEQYHIKCDDNQRDIVKKLCQYIREHHDQATSSLRHLINASLKLKLKGRFGSWDIPDEKYN